MFQQKHKLSVGVFGAVFDEEGRILCVKRGYAPRTWTTPGGGVDRGESITEAFKREVEEETGFVVEPMRLIGAYHSVEKNDLVLSIEGEVTGRGEGGPGGEISDTGFFSENNLPRPMNPRTLKRIRDAFEGREGVLHVFEKNN